MSIKLVVPTLLQMGWIESPTYLFSVSETGQDVAEQYIETPVGSLAPYMFVKLTEVNSDFEELPNKDISNEPFNYLLEVYTDGYIVLAIPRSQDPLHYVANAIIREIHHVFPSDKDDKKDMISLIIF